MTIAMLLLASYLLGSIPFGLLVGLARGVDIRQVGSGNIGATNVSRALGRNWGILVFVLDFLKGFLPVLAARLLSERLGDSPFVRYDLAVYCALGAVLGHVFPIWLRLRGGKAGATGLGVGAVLVWQAMVVAAAVWLVVVAITRYVSLATMLAGCAFLISYFVLALIDASPFDRSHIALTVFSTAVTLLIIGRHKENIRRLLAGTENKLF